MTARVTPLPSRDRDATGTRRAILDAAEALLAAGGEEGLSIRELCQRAGVTPPTVYHHFGDKGALVARVVDACFEEFDRATAAGDEPDDPVEALRWAFDRYLDYGRRHPTHYRLLFPRKRAQPSAPATASYERLVARVGRAAAGGRLRAPVEDVAPAFWAAAHGVTSLVIAGFLAPDAPAIGLAREALLGQLTRPAPRRRRAGARR